MSLFHRDRRLGARIRAAVARVRGGPTVARALAGATSPVFQMAVGATLAARGTRLTGAQMLAAGAGGATVARVLRDAIARPRPGARDEGGFPSRHAAAATAIAGVALSRGHRWGAMLALGAAVGSLARIATADHEPADIAAGAVLGAMVALVVVAPTRAVRSALRVAGVR